MNVIKNMPFPEGYITIKQNTEVKFENTFTYYGLREVYKSGKNVILNTANGGIFKYLHIGNGSTIIDKNSTGLSDPKFVGTLQTSDLTFITDPDTQIRYANFTTTWRLPSGISEFQQIGMSNSSNGSINLLCGRTLTSPIELDSQLTTDITYLVKIPILSQIGTIGTGNVDIEGQTYQFNLEGVFHIETPTTLSTVLPYETSLVTSGNLSRMYVNNILLPTGNSSYECIVSTINNQFKYDIVSSIINYNSSLEIVNINMGNSNPSNFLQSDFPIRIVFNPSPTKPVGLDMAFDFSLLINFIE